MGFNFFGFSFGKKGIPKSEQEVTTNKNLSSFVPPEYDDGSVYVDTAGVWATSVDLEGAVRNEFELITRYKEMSMYPEVDSAIDDIVNEAIVGNEDEPPVSIILDDLPRGYTNSTKDLIRDAFDKTLRLLNFNNDCYDIFKKWYVDGRLAYHKVIDNDKPKNGIMELRYIDPRQIRKVKEIQRTPAQGRATAAHVDLIDIKDEYYLFNPRGILSNNSQYGMKINLDAICYVHSGVVDKRSKMIVSNLHKAIKPFNQLRMIEDAMVIYRLSRAPERRIFYVDVGTLPKAKAEQYMSSLISKYRNKLVYDADTGETKGDRRHLSMMEDYWLPRREGSVGTSIDTLRGAENLGEIADVTYFQKKLYKALNVPITRLDSDTGFSIGRATEITRDELKFTKFIARMRNRFSQLFFDLLRTELILTGVCSADEWEEIKEFINFDFLSDSYFSELKESEVLRDRLSLLREIKEYEGTYYSRAYIRTKVLKQTEDEIEDIDKEIEEEKDKYAEEQEEQMMLMQPQPQMGKKAPGGNLAVVQQNKPPKTPSVVDNKALKKEVKGEEKKK